MVPDGAVKLKKQETKGDTNTLFSCCFFKLRNYIQIHYDAQATILTSTSTLTFTNWHTPTWFVRHNKSVFQFLFSHDSYRRRRACFQTTGCSAGRRCSSPPPTQRPLGTQTSIYRHGETWPQFFFRKQALPGLHNSHVLSLEHRPHTVTMLVLKLLIVMHCIQLISNQ